MRILSPEKKYLYYLMISQLHEDGYTQQALQLEVSTIHSSGSVKASDKLSRLFSSCLSSVNEAMSYFNANSNKAGSSYNLAGRKRHGNQSPANIRAANLANLAKRRRTAASLDSTSMFQDSIKKCVKLVTNDLQKATSDISPGPSSMLKATTPKQTAQSSMVQKSPAARQLFSAATGLSSKNQVSKGIPNVSNSFLKGISLLKTSNLPSVTPYTAPTVSSKHSTQATSPSSVAAQILAQQRMTSESAAVVRVTKNITNDPVIIDVEAPSVSSASSLSGLQLTQPRSVPLPSIPNATLPQPQSSHQKPQSSLKLVTNPKPVLTVGQTNANALKSLVNKISKRPILSIPKKLMTPISQQQSSLEVVVIDETSPVKTKSLPTTNIVTTTSQRKSVAPALTSPRASPIGQVSIPPPIASSKLSVPPVLSALGLTPSPQSPSKIAAKATPPTSQPAVPPLSHLPHPMESPPRPNPVGSPTRTNIVESPSRANLVRTPPRPNPVGTPPRANPVGTPPRATPVGTPPPRATPVTSSPTAAAKSPQSSSSSAPPASTAQPNGLKSPTATPSSAGSSPSPKMSTSETSTSSATDKTSVVKNEEASLDPLIIISCVQCPPADDQKFMIPSQETPKATAGEVSNTSSDTDFPSEIFAEETNVSNTETSTEEPFRSPTSLSDALHAASDALLEQ